METPRFQQNIRNDDDNEIAISTEQIAGTPNGGRDVRVSGEGSAIDAAERRELEALGIEVLESSPSVAVVIVGDAAFTAALARQAGVETRAPR